MNKCKKYNHIRLTCPARNLNFKETSRKHLRRYRCSPYGSKRQALKSATSLNQQSCAPCWLLANIEGSLARFIDFRSPPLSLQCTSSQGARQAKCISTLFDPGDSGSELQHALPKHSPHRMCFSAVTAHTRLAPTSGKHYSTSSTRSAYFWLRKASVTSLVHWLASYKKVFQHCLSLELFWGYGSPTHSPSPSLTRLRNAKCKITSVHSVSLLKTNNLCQSEIGLAIPQIEIWCNVMKSGSWQGNGNAQVLCQHVAQGRRLLRGTSNFCASILFPKIAAEDCLCPQVRRADNPDTHDHEPGTRRSFKQDGLNHW